LAEEPKFFQSAGIWTLSFGKKAPFLRNLPQGFFTFAGLFDNPVRSNNLMTSLAVLHNPGVYLSLR
jgi:hypothetical protein